MYDTTRSLAARIDNDSVARVEDLMRRVVLRLRTQLISRCGGDVPARFGAVQVTSLAEVFDRVRGQTGAAAAQFRLMPADLVGFVVLEGPLIQRLVGMLLGEDPKTTNDDYAMRPLTELDLRFLRRICDDIVQNLVRACTMHPRPEPIIELVVPNPRSAPSLPKTTTVVDVTIDFGPPHEPFGLASIVLPAQAEGVLWPAKSERRPTPGALLRPDEGIDRVMPVSVEIVAELTRKKLPLSDVRKLHVGQILELGPLRDVELRLSGQTAFTAEAGERDGVRSVRIRKKVPRLPV